MLFRTVVAGELVVRLMTGEVEARRARKAKVKKSIMVVAGSAVRKRQRKVAREGRAVE